MSSTEPNPYLRTQVMTASPPELRLMLFDGALRFAEMGKAGLASNDAEAAFKGISRCQEILVELISSLQPEHAPDLCAKLSGLYTFMYTRLIDASRQQSPEIMDEVLKLLRFERETWAMLLKKLAAENAAAARLSATPDAEPPVPGSRRDSPLVGGSVSVEG